MPHLYADDTQIHGSCSPGTVNVLSSQISGCTGDVAAWMKSNRLQLNSDKTEVLLCATNRRLHQLPVSAMLIDGVPITPAVYVRDLRIYLYRDLSMRMHIQRRLLCQDVLLPCISCDRFVTRASSHISDTDGHTRPLQTRLRQQCARRYPHSVLNAAAWLIFHLRPHQ